VRHFSKTFVFLNERTNVNVIAKPLGRRARSAVVRRFSAEVRPVSE
jgi:hypothetical protein